MKRAFNQCQWAIVVLLAIGVASAEDKATDLKKTANGDGYEHVPSKSRFIPPKGWETVETRTVGYSSMLTLRKPHPEGEGQPGIEVTIFWTPLNVSFEEADKIEHSLLVMLYGADKVGKSEPVKVGDKNGSKVMVSEGPTRNGKEAGIVYFFETGSGDSRWKVKLRGIVQKATQADSLKAVEALLEGIKW